MKPGILSISIFVLITTVARAATLSMRWEGSSSDTLQRLVCEEATLELVLELGENESLGFGIIFPSAVVIDGEGNVIEVIDFAPEAGPLADATYDRSAMPSGNPYSYGEGIGFGPAQYGLNLGNANLQGPVTVVLDNVIVHAISLGQAHVGFSEGLLTPQVFNLALSQYGLLPAGTADIEGSLVLGLGDSRSGGAGPLVFEVVNEVPPPPLNENQNTSVNTNSNTGSGNDNNNGGGNDGGSGGGGLCGAGMMFPTLLSVGLIPLLGLRIGRKPGL